MMIKLIIIGLLFHTSFALAENKCVELFESTNDVQTKIDNTIKNLAELKINLDTAKAQGLNSIELTALSHNFKSKSTEFYKFVRKNNLMTKDQYLNRIIEEIENIQNKNLIQKNQNHEAKKEEEDRLRKSQTDTLNVLGVDIDGTHAVLHRIQPGSFKMGESRKQVKVTISKAFDMMATQTTQIIWKKIAELANSKLKEKYEINEDPSTHTGDTFPVEEVSYTDVQIWLAALNKLSELGEPSLNEIIVGHKKGDVYRLPTSAEWEFVVRGRGQYNDDYFFGNDSSQLGEYAWYRGNSLGGPHSVAQKLPLLVDGNDFYDVYGNVHEWVSDWSQDRLEDGIDPQGPDEGIVRTIRGNNDWDDPINYRTYIRMGVEPHIRRHDTGFRFIRDLGARQ